MEYESDIGKVITVGGPVDPDNIGVALMHEHLFLDLRKNHIPHLKMVNIPGRSEPIMTSEDFPATELKIWEAKLDFENLHLAKNVAPLSDNYVLDDENVAVDEVNWFKESGGGTIVDVTSIGMKRDPEALNRVSQATGINLIMGTGYYQKVFHPEDMDQLSVDTITAEIIHDVKIGVRDTGIRSGIIGEIGVNGDPITRNEEKSIRAASRASLQTGAAITFHRGGTGSERHITLNLVEEEGADLTRVIMGHSDEIAGDFELLESLLVRGVYIQFDLIGREYAVDQINAISPETSLDLSVTGKDAHSISKLIEAGYEDKILLSHDVCWKTHLKKYGGFGYSFIIERFLPYLRQIGVGDTQINKMMIENPKSILPLVEPI
tara:strand:- start:6068 stop:7201 length:1134 start_codon:yes stop_codon:yes gene_type:complete